MIFLAPPGSLLTKGHFDLAPNRNHPKVKRALLMIFRH